MKACIPEEWIKQYIDSLLKTAAMFPAGSIMQNAAALRADHAMDLVKAYRENK